MVFRTCPKVVVQEERLASLGLASVEFVHANNPIPKVSGNRISRFRASVDDGPNVQLSLIPSLCKDVFWRLPHLFIRRFRRGLGCEFLKARIIEADRQWPSRGFILPQIKSRIKRTDNRHDSVRHSKLRRGVDTGITEDIPPPLIKT